MRTSIVVPAYNAAPFLGQAVESVLAQTVGDWELVVVDDGSTDGTAAAARASAGRDPRIRLVQQPNGGQAQARNRGLAETSAASPYLIFLDADDVWEREALEVLLAALEADPSAEAASGLSRYIDERGLPFEPGELEVWGRRRSGVAGRRLVPWPPDQPITLGVLAYRNCIGTPGQVLIRRSALEAAGPFDPATSPCEDWDLWLRLSQHGPIASVDQVLLNKRKHAANISRQRELMYRQQLFVRGKLLAAPLPRAQRVVVLTANWHWGGYLCGMKLRWARQSLAHGQRAQAAHLLAQVASTHLRRLRGLPVA
jgi:glycosyltransferase involved in cell wall biosynthesis